MYNKQMTAWLVEQGVTEYTITEGTSSFNSLMWLLKLIKDHASDAKDMPSSNYTQDAIRLQDETFPEVGMLLEQIGDTAENRQVIFDEMIVVMSNLVNQSITPETETPEDYYKYILEEPADDEIERIYRQANYYAQFKNSVEINDYLDELMEQYTIAKEMGATDCGK